MHYEAGQGRSQRPLSSDVSSVHYTLFNVEEVAMPNLSVFKRSKRVFLLLSQVPIHLDLSTWFVRMSIPLISFPNGALSIFNLRQTKGDATFCSNFF